MSNAKYWSEVAQEYNDTAAHLTGRVASKAFESCVNHFPAPGEDGFTLIDCACGTGALTGLAAQHYKSKEGVCIIACDYAEGMVDYVNTLAASENWSNVQCQTMDAEAMSFHDGISQAVFCIAGVICMDDGLKAVQEMHRILSPGGLICFTTWKSVAGIPLAMASFKQMGFKPAEAPITQAKWQDRAWLGEMMAKQGFTDTRIEEQTVDFQVPESGLLDFGNSLQRNPAFGQFARGMTQEQREAWPQALADAARSLYGIRDTYSFENVALIISGKRV